MPTVEELLRRAEEYRRLAPTCTTPGLSELLLSLADDMERAAGKLGGTMTVQQQQQVQPDQDKDPEKK